MTATMSKQDRLNATLTNLRAALPGGAAEADRAQVAIVFNAANAPLLPVLRACGIPVATHVDGLEWKRAKWGPLGKRYYRWAEAVAVRGNLIVFVGSVKDVEAWQGQATRVVNLGGGIPLRQRGATPHQATPRHGIHLHVPHRA